MSDTELAPSTAAGADTPPARKVIYCGVCSLPPEYCEYGGTQTKCEAWLKKAHPDLHDRLYSEEAVNASMAGLSVEARERAEKDAKKKAAKARAADEKKEEAKANAMVYIKRIERNKRKFVTAVQGMELHGLDLKKVAKDFGKKFACGSSVTKRSDGQGDEIVVQGDLAYEIEDEIVEKYEDIPDDNIEIVEDKKKK